MVALGARQPRERIDDECRLVEPPRPEPPAMQRHRHKEHRVDRPQRRKPPRHELRHQLRVPGASSIFET